MTGAFQNCSIHMCSPNFQPKLGEILKIRETLNETLNQLHKQLPYLELFILRMTSDTADFPSLVHHDLRYVELLYNGDIYRVYAVKSHEVSNVKGPHYKLIEYPPSDLLDYIFSDMKVDKICENGMSMCAFKIYVNREDADCFHGDQVVSSANVFPLSQCVVILFISFEIISFMTI